MVETPKDLLQKIENLKDGEPLELFILYNGPKVRCPPSTEREALHLQELCKEYMDKQARWYDEKDIPYRRFDNLVCFYASMNKDQAKELLENSEIVAMDYER